MISEKHKTILALLADGEFHSGNELADALNMSRASIWKYLNDLPALGLHYSAVNGKGYRLDRSLELLDHDKIQSNLNPQAQSLISSLHILDCIDSTNVYLNHLAAAGAPSGSVCFAEQQTAGKGRRGRQWISPFGHNIYLSVLWRFQSSPSAISGLSLAIGVAVIRALNHFYPDTFSLKWPNDIYYQHKKLGGILIEVSGESEGPCAAIIGLGLNIYLPLDEAKEITQAWADLSHLNKANSNFNRNALAAILLNQLTSILAEFQENGVSAYLEEWRQYDCLKGKTATLFVGIHRFEGIVNGIDNQGLLSLINTDGSIQSFASGEVSFNSHP